MRTWLDAQSLEDAVEIIHVAGVVAVDVDRGVARFHFDFERAIVAVGRAWISVAAGKPRIVVPAVVPAEAVPSVASGIETAVVAIGNEDRRARCCRRYRRAPHGSRDRGPIR